MPGLRAPTTGFPVKDGRVDTRAFEKWLREQVVTPEAGTVTVSMLATDALDYVGDTAQGAAGDAIAAHVAAADPHAQYATDVAAAALAAAAQAAAIASAAASLAAHVAALDPHAQYLTQAEADLLYAALGITTTGVPEGSNQYFTGNRARAAARLWNNRIVTANTTVVTTDDVILVDASGGARTVNLPALSTVANLRVTVKKIDSSGNNVVIDPSGAETIDGAATAVINTQWASLTFFAEAGATGWFIV